LVLAAGLATAAGVCLLTFQLIGSRVDAQGVLREPFFLLPISVLLACGGGVALIGAWLWPRAKT
ncbi:MAG: DUF3955 domain-containing protein, partial [Cyanobacteriota bacterium]|nr:DUF3955 domain-containing protein [Cyanobacteriota bacterium]